MPLRQPLEEWSFVTKAETDENSAHFFTVANDGTFTEVENRIITADGTISRLEFKILDALVDQINREPIPQDHRTFRPDGDDRNNFLTLSNDPFESGQTLFSDDAAATSYAADDALDFVEIAALNAFLGYLDHKYGPDLDI